MNPDRRIRLARIILAASAKKLELLAKKYPNVTPEMWDMAVKADPAKGKSLEWIARQLTAGEIILPEDSPGLRTVLQTFYKVKRSPNTVRQYGINPDISQHTIHTLNELDDTVKGKFQKSSLMTDVPDAEKVYDDGTYAVLKPTTVQAACTLSDSTHWCTINKNTAENYLSSGMLLVWFRNGEKFAQSDGNGQFMDIKNSRFTQDATIGKIYYELYGHLPNNLAERVPEIETIIAQDPLAQANYAIKVIKGRWPEAEPNIIKHPLAAVTYAAAEIGRWPEAEPAIASDPQAAFEYASRVIKGRWPEGEPAILTDGEMAFNYASRVVRGRVPEMEPAILQNPMAAYNYASRVISGPWPEAESVIASDAEASVSYARSFFPGGWPPGEPAIVKDPEQTNRYLSSVKKGRWPAAEPTLMKNAKAAFDYAINTIEGRFPEAEPTIMADAPELVGSYAAQAIKGPWPEAEPIIAQSKDQSLEYAAYALQGRFPAAEELIAKTGGDDIIWYAQDMVKGRWPEAEKELLNGDPWRAVWYAKDVVEGRWPELEQALLTAKPSEHLVSALSNYARSVLKAQWPEAEEKIATEPFPAYLYAKDVLKGHRFPQAEKILMESNYKEKYENLVH
jgi:hypothetical protein